MIDVPAEIFVDPFAGVVNVGAAGAATAKKFAVTFSAALMVTVVDALDAFATAPDQPLKLYPEIGVAMIGTAVAAL